MSVAISLRKWFSKTIKQYGVLNEKNLIFKNGFHYCQNIF